jgi:hypothetical protein
MNEYHHQRNLAALKAVEEMMKHPLNLEQVKEQVERLRKVDEIRWAREETIRNEFINTIGNKLSELTGGKDIYLHPQIRSALIKRIVGELKR